MAKLNLATCQFPIAAELKRNLRYVLRQIEQAKAKGAHLVHFSEACLSGYLGAEIKSASEVDWDALAAATHEVMAAAKRHRVWAVLGSNHRLTGRHKPHNSLYVINAKGDIVDRYDKRFCTGSNATNGDLKHYSPGNELTTFDVRGVRCGLIICHDFRYPELFRAYKQKGVHLMLASFHNAGMTRDRYDRYMISVPATLQAAAASNHFAVSANNGTRKHAWASFVVNAEGAIVDRARPHRSAVLVNMIDTNASLYDASIAWRDRSMRGILHSGKLVNDPRSRNRKTV